MDKIKFQTYIGFLLSILFVFSCSSEYSSSEAVEAEAATFGMDGLKIGDTVQVKNFCCENLPERTGFHLPILLENQLGVVVDINADRIQVRCRNQRFQVGIYSTVRFVEVSDSLGFEPGRFIMIGDSVAIEDELWDEKIAAFREVVGETDPMYDLKYLEGQNFVEIPDVVVHSHPDHWRKLK